MNRLSPMTRANLLDPQHPIHDMELMRQLHGRRLSLQLHTLCVIGAHRFDELRLVNRIFPNLRRIYVFEPLPEPLLALRALAARDPRISVFPVAVSDRDGTAPFHVTSNNGESSSLLKFGSHSELFPEVRVQQTIQVSTRLLSSVVAEHKLQPPDFLLVDVQGAEYQVLEAIGAELLAQVRLIYSEVSTDHVYAASGLLPDVEKLLAPRFVNLGYAALRPDVPMHGNVVFVARDDVPATLALTVEGRLRQGLRRWQRQRRAKRARANAVQR
jgi:FkbM family methyltransferase